MMPKCQALLKAMQQTPQEEIHLLLLSELLRRHPVLGILWELAGPRMMGDKEYKTADGALTRLTDKAKAIHDFEYLNRN